MSTEDNYFNTCHKCDRPIMTQQTSLTTSQAITNSHFSAKTKKRHCKNRGFQKIDKFIKNAFCCYPYSNKRTNRGIEINSNKEQKGVCQCYSSASRESLETIATTVNAYTQPWIVPSNYHQDMPASSIGQHWIFRTGWTPHPDSSAMTEYALCDNCYERVHKSMSECPFCDENLS